MDFIRHCALCVLGTNNYLLPIPTTDTYYRYRYLLPIPITDTDTNTDTTEIHDSDANDGGSVKLTFLMMFFNGFSCLYGNEI